MREEAWSKQRQVMEAVRDHRRTAVHSCHTVGKSHIASRLACWWLDSHPPGTAFVVTTAPTFSLVKVVLWRYINQAHRKGNLLGRTNYTEWYIDDEIVAYGRKPADHDEGSFQGIHARYVLVILDEACGIPRALWVAADTLASNEDCRMLAIGNPDNPASHFRQVCEPHSLWHVIGISAFESPNLTGEPVSDDLRKLLIDRDWVEEKAREWGTDNPIYLSKILGQFPRDDPHAVVRVSDLADCRLALDTPYAPEELLPVELGVDVGGGGDETVIRERRGVCAGREWREFSDQPHTLAPLVLRIIEQTGATRVKIDAVGIGWGLVGELENYRREGRHDASIVPVNASEASRDQQKYANVRAEMWWEVGRLMSQERLWDLSKMANGDTTCAQLLEPRWEIGARGEIKIEKKDEIRKRLERSPDNADALLLAYYEPPGAYITDWYQDYVKARTA